MKKRLTILTCFMVLCSFVFGQSHWGKVETGNYQFNMSAIVSIEIDGIQQTDSEIEIGAFCEGVLRGYGKISLTWNQYTSWFQIHGTEGDNITYRLWKPATETEPGKELFTDFTTVFNSANTVGQYEPYDPQVINFFTPVAEVDGVKYASFEEALAAVKENSTLTLLDDVTISEKINVTSSLTIDGNGYTLTYTGSARAIDVTKETNGANLTVKYLTVDCTASYCERGINYNTNGKLVLEEVTVKGTNLSYALNMPGSADEANVAITNSTLRGCIALNVWGENSEITATDSHFISVDNASHEGYAAVKLNNDGTTSAEGSIINITGGSIKREGSYIDDSYAASNATSTGKINISDTTEVDGEVIEMVAVIKYDDNSYSFKSLEDAIAKAENGEVIVVIRDFTLESAITVPAGKEVVLDLNGKTIIYNSTVQGEAMITNKGTLTINDEISTGEINYNYTGAADNSYSKGNYTIANYATLTVNGGKINIAKLSGHAKYPIDNNSTIGDAILVINGGHLYNYNTSAIRQFCNSKTYQNSVTINGGLVEGYCAVWMQNPGSNKVNGQLSITGGEIKSTAKAYVNGEAELSDVGSAIYCTIAGLGGSWDATSAISITGGTINENVSLEEEAPASVTIGEAATFNGYVLIPIVAVNGVGYPTFDAAFAATTEENNTVTLLKNAEGPGVVINKDVTIDFNEKTYTFNGDAVGSTGTTTNGFQIKKSASNVVLKNGTLNVTAADKYAILIQNYANLELIDMYLDGNNLDYSSNVSYVLSNNSGDVKILGSTSIIANQEGPANNFAFDSYKDKNYEAPKVTVNTTGTIQGAVEVSATLDIQNLGEHSNIEYIRLDGAGQLFHNGISTTIKRNIVGTSIEENAGWYTIASPVGRIEHQNVGGLLNENGTHDLYRYNEETAMWENVKNAEHTDFTTLEAGRGYIYANTEDTELSFKGNLNTAAVKQELTALHEELTGFNLIGNPFTYDITLENISGAELASGFYTLTKEGAWGASIESIGACQGALIKTTEAATITINPAVGAKRTASENNGALAITASNAKYSDVAYVSFNEGLGLDKINHRNAEIPMVYVPVDGVNYAVAMMNQDVTEIPVSFKAMTMGQYTIGVEAQDCEYAMMTLVDRFTGEETNLLLEDYSFIAKTNDNVDRFIIKLALANNNGNSNDNFAFINNGMMYIYNIEGQGVVNVYDVTGRPVAEYNVATSANISTADFAAGVYVIRMSDENGVKTQKIIID